jgi:hypothetical protein
MRAEKRPKIRDVSSDLTVSITISKDAKMVKGVRIVCKGKDAADEINDLVIYLLRTLLFRLK